MSFIQQGFHQLCQGALPNLIVCLLYTGEVTPPPLHAHRYLTGYGQEMGGITCHLYNNDPINSVRVLYLETVPWFVRLYLHTLEVTNNVKLVVPGEIVWLVCLCVC